MTITQSYCRWPALIIKNDVGGRTGTPTELQKQKKQGGGSTGVAELESKSQTAWFLQQNFHLTRPWGRVQVVLGEWATAEQNGDWRNSIPASGISRKTRKNHEIGGSHEGPLPSDAEIVVKDLYWAQQPLYAARQKIQDSKVFGPS